MAYKGTSTKVHVVPTEPRFTDYAASSVTDGRGSIGRASMRSSKLAQSYSSEVMSPTVAPSSFAMSQSGFRPSEKKKILITRLFPVVLPTDDEAVPSHGNEGQGAEDGGPTDNAAAQLRNAGFSLAATVVRGGDDLFAAKLPQRLVYVMGAEGEGMDARLAAACDARLSIPGTGAVESLNVAAATAVFLAQWKQRL